jgi:hypothetical protein
MCLSSSGVLHLAQILSHDEKGFVASGCASLFGFSLDFSEFFQYCILPKRVLPIVRCVMLSIWYLVGI